MLKEANGTPNPEYRKVIAQQVKEDENCLQELIDIMLERTGCTETFFQKSMFGHFADAEKLNKFKTLQSDNQEGKLQLSGVSIARKEVEMTRKEAIKVHQ